MATPGVRSRDHRPEKVERSLNLASSCCTKNNKKIKLKIDLGVICLLRSAAVKIKIIIIIKRRIRKKIRKIIIIIMIRKIIIMIIIFQIIKILIIMILIIRKKF